MHLELIAEAAHLSMDTGSIVLKHCIASHTWSHVRGCGQMILFLAFPLLKGVEDVDGAVDAAEGIHSVEQHL